QPLLRSPQGRARLVRERRILDDRVGKDLDDITVETRIRRLIDDRPVVLALEVEHAHASRRRDRAHVLVTPVAHRVELELELRIQLQPGANLQPGRDDETDGTVLAPERAPEREAVLSQRQVEPRALERPAPVVLESVRVEAARELADRHA